MYNVKNINTHLLIEGDAFQKMKEISDSSVDLILTDPPYNLSEYSTGNMKFDWRNEINNDVAKWDKVPFNPEKLLKDFIRILKPTGNIFIFTSLQAII